MSSKRSLDTDICPASNEISTHVNVLNEDNDICLHQDKRKKKQASGDVPPTNRRPRRKKIKIQSIPLENPCIYSDHGLRFVKPYWFQYMTSAKGRWQGRRLLDVLLQEFHGKNPDFFNVAIRLGRLLVNDKPTCVDYVLKDLDYMTNIAHRHESPILDKSIKIIVNNDDVLVVDKPCSIPVHPCGRYYYNSVTQILKRDHNIDNLRLLHRLDRLTSGLVIMTKHHEMDIKLKSEILHRSVHKEYLCMVDGIFPDKPQECDESIGCLEPKMGIQRIVAKNSPDGKTCLTRFELLKTDGKRSIVRCLPETGRTHQIRVHLQFLGFPIVNDYMYNNYIWGADKGKGGAYGIDEEELRKRVLEEFAAEKWVENFVESCENFMTHKATLKDDDPGAKIDRNCIKFTETPSSTFYDPFCIDCHLDHIKPTEQQLQMYLHCLKYKGSDWQYETELPDWVKDFDSVT